MADPRPDRIHIIDLKINCIIGVNDWERKKKQDVVLGITLDTDLRPAGRSDRLEDSVDYKTLKDRLVAEVESSEFLLIERLAERVAEVCLEDARIAAVRVRLEKPGALRSARSVAVEIVRSRP